MCSGGKGTSNAVVAVSAAASDSDAGRLRRREAKLGVITLADDTS